MNSISMITIDATKLFQALSFVPTEKKVEFLQVLFVGEKTDSNNLSEVLALSQDFDRPTSFQLSFEQARMLRTRANPKTWAVIKEAVANAKDEVATVDWSKVKAITGVDNWSQFAKGLLSGLNRTLHNIAGVDADAVLLWEGDGWEQDDKGDYNHGQVVIDGPVVTVLRTVCNVESDT